MSFFDKVLNDTYCFNLNIIDYLQESLEDDKENCKGWDYLKSRLTYELREILEQDAYWSLEYNRKRVDFIINSLGVDLDEDLKEQLGSFVYVWNEIKRECEKEEREQKLRVGLLERGFKEQKILSLNEEEDKRIKEELKQLDGVKVICVLDVNKIGLMGSFDSKEEVEGKFVYDSKGLMLIPKRSRTKGYLIRNKFYYKEI